MGQLEIKGRGESNVERAGEHPAQPFIELALIGSYGTSAALPIIGGIKASVVCVEGPFMRAEAFYWGEDDEEDQWSRRMLNVGRAYTEDANCEFCGIPLYVSAFQCIRCNSLACTSCISREGRCAACLGA